MDQWPPNQADYATTCFNLGGSLSPEPITASECDRIEIWRNQRIP